MSAFMSFDEVMTALGIPENELIRMVSEGEIRAYRRDARMVFRASDIRKLRSREELRAREKAPEPAAALTDESEDDDLLEDAPARPGEEAQQAESKPAAPREVAPPSSAAKADVPFAPLAESPSPQSSPSFVSLRDVVVILLGALVVAALLTLLF